MVTYQLVASLVNQTAFSIITCSISTRAEIAYTASDKALRGKSGLVHETSPGVNGL